MSIIVFEHGDNDRIKRFGAVLNVHGHRLEVIRPDAGDPIPPDLDDVDGVVACGGPASANDDADWIRAEAAFLRQAHEAALPVVGICLGSQILAKSLGGEVAPMERVELGWHEITLTATGREDPVFTGIGWTHNQFHWHRDMVTRLPDGARLLASSAACKVQAWSLGLRTYAFQFHPEIDLGSIEGWMRSHPEDLKAADIDAATLRSQSEAAFPAFERVTDRLFESLALFVMPVDRRYRGLVRDLHH